MNGTSLVGMRGVHLMTESNYKRNYHEDCNDSNNQGEQLTHKRQEDKEMTDKEELMDKYQEAKYRVDLHETFDSKCSLFFSRIKIYIAIGAVVLTIGALFFGSTIIKSVARGHIQDISSEVYSEELPKIAGKILDPIINEHVFRKTKILAEHVDKKMAELDGHVDKLLNEKLNEKILSGIVATLQQDVGLKRSLVDLNKRLESLTKIQEEIFTIKKEYASLKERLDKGVIVFGSPSIVSGVTRYYSPSENLFQGFDWRSSPTEQK